MTDAWEVLARRLTRLMRSRLDNVIYTMEGVMSKPTFAFGPWVVVEEDKWPFDIVVRAPDGSLEWSERRCAHSSRQNTLAECKAAVGFPADERAQVVKAIERQMASIHLRAAAPDMYEALPDLSAVITWLRNGGDPKWACTELEIYQARIAAAKAKAEGRAGGQEQ
jgi:hypothetical protein